MNPVDILKSILSHCVCDAMRCDECKRLFDMEECPSDRFDYDTKCEFSKNMATALKNDELSQVKEFTVDDLLRVVQEAYEEYTKPKGPLD